MSGRSFTMVSPAMWRSKRFKAASTEGRLLYVYFLTSEHQSNAGCHRLPPGYACTDLGWTLAEFERARGELIDLGLIAFDEDTDEVFICRWFKHCPPTNPKHRAGVLRSIEGIESDTLREMAESELEGDASYGDPLGPADTGPPYRAISGGLANNPLVRRATGGV